EHPGRALAELRPEALRGGRGGDRGPGARQGPRSREGGQERHTGRSPRLGAGERGRRAAHRGEGPQEGHLRPRQDPEPHRLMQAARAILASLLLALAACAGPVSTEPTARAQGEALEQRPAEVCEPSPLEAAELEALAFSSPERCDALVRSGRLLPRAPGTVRFGSWNVRFFPDGGPSGPSKPTDVAWLACAIAFMQVDVLAVQEFLAPVGDSAARVGEKHRELVA